MANIVNYSDIVSKVYQSYESGTKERTAKLESSSIHVPKLAAFSPTCGLSVGGGWLDAYLDEDYALDVEMADVFKSDLLENFSILPNNIFMEHDSLGVKFEWVPSKLLCVPSKLDYVLLYRSFAQYLEDIPGTGIFKDAEFKLCFYPLYLSEPNDTYQEDFSNKEFSKEYFGTTELAVQTPNAVIYFDQLEANEDV